MGKQVRFEGEEEQEQTLLLLRPHIFTNFGWLLAISALLVIPLFVKPFFDLAQLEVSIDSTTLFLVLFAWDLLLISVAFQKFLYWYFNTYIVTNQRVVDMDFFGLFYRKTSQTALRNIEDVSVSKGGIAQNFFDYGDLMIQTAGAQEHFEFLSVPDPEGVQRKLLELVTQYKRSR